MNRLVKVLFLVFLFFTVSIFSVGKPFAQAAAVLETRQEGGKTNIGKPPEDFHTEGKSKIEKNESDDIWEMTIKGIAPMYNDPDVERGKSQKEMDEAALKIAVQQAGSKEAAALKIVESAWDYFNGGYPNIAMRKFNQAWSLEPKNAEVYFGFGCILSSRQDPAGAINMYTKALDLNPEYYEVYANRALDYFSMQEFDKAILDFTKAIEIRPNEAQTYNDRAVAYFFKKEYNRCREDIHKAQALGYNVNPEFISALKQESGSDK
ncbi:MAG: tetratricopeptide repeat protein [Candidatus Omnitrophica bacterium]|nr:tetratricopeptide repeat protein [Candidatus Omnitrophota bacterium]